MWERMNNVLEQMSLSVDQLAKMQNDFEGFVALRKGMVVCLTHTAQFDFEFGAFGLQLLGEFLSHGKGFEGIVALTFGFVETFLELRCVDFLFVDEESETVGFALVLFDLCFEFLRFLRELCSESLELFELQTLIFVSTKGLKNLLLPVFELFDEEVVAFGDFGNFAIGAGLEIDVILPSFVDFACERVLLPDHFVEMPHADLSHDGLFLAAFEDG